MRRFVLALALALLGTPLFAVAPQFWKIENADELLSGELEGMAITSDGGLKAAPAIEKMASFSDPFVLSQATDGAGVRYFGTGNDGKVYRLAGRELKLLWTAPEPEIYALAFSGGSLYAGSSPNGKVYRIDPATGTATPLYDPKQAYIWALQPDGSGSLLVATGVEGKLFRVNARGEGEEWFDAPETHLRSLAMGAGGKVLAGGSGDGRIYEISGKGVGRALYDSSLSEISAIWFDRATGVAWAAGATSVLPTTAPPPKQQPGAAKPAESEQATPKKEAGDSAASNVEVSFSFDEGSPQAQQPTGAAEVYRIDKDGYVDMVRKFDREIVYAITGGPDGSIYLSTGPQGRVYQLKGNEISLIATLPEKQVVSFSTEGPVVVATTTNSGAVYRISDSLSSRAEFRSAVKDTERFSRFGTYLVEGKGLAGSKVTMSFRSGNSDSPDTTWSGWIPSPGTAGSVGAPPARYLQWKIDAENPSAGFGVDSVSIAYVNRNVRPAIEAVGVQDPGVVYISGNYPAAPQVVEATNPDENGIFSSLDSPSDSGIPGKKFFRRGYRTVAWKATDPNNDRLRYSVSFRRAGESRWLRLRNDIDDNQLNFDTSQLPDGDYQLKITATDAPDNPDMPLTDEREGTAFVVDNTPPVITWSTEGGAAVVKVTDAASPVMKLEYSVDAEKWIRVLPADGISDSRQETYRIDLPDLTSKFVIVRAVDSFFNVATASIGKAKQK